MSATATKVEVPDIGDFDDVPVIEILVSVGDSVAVEDPLVTLESDKATMDVPAPLAGVVKEISVSIGDRVSQGSVLMSIEGGGPRCSSSTTAWPSADNLDKYPTSSPEPEDPEDCWDDPLDAAVTLAGLRLEVADEGLGGGSGGQLVELLGGEAVQPGQPVGTGDPQHAAGGPVPDRGRLLGRALL